jgi:hypothetical protein
MSWKNFRIIAFIALFGLMMVYLRTNSIASPSDAPFKKFERYKPGSYAAKIYDLKNIQAERASQFQAEKPLEERFETLSKSEKELINRIEKEIFPHWYGTKYDFYGTTETPGKGKIACGYFVTTVLRDVGVPIQRIKMAQAASERMIKTMVDEDNIQRFRKVPIKKFVYAVEDMGEGLYVVGLDTHAGFIFNDGVEVRFIHATARKGIQQVINEKAVTSPSLINSKYRVVGKITGDEDFVKRWLTSASLDG